MANSYIFVDGRGNSHTLYVTGTSTDSFAIRKTERGHGWPDRKNFIETLPLKYANKYRGTTFTGRIYVQQFELWGTGAVTHEALIGNWEDWMRPYTTRGTLQRTTVAGTVRHLDCVPLAPDWQGSEQMGPFGEVVVQVWQADFPWWRGASASTAAGAYTGTTAGNVTVGNAGDIPTYRVT